MTCLSSLKKLLSSVLARRLPPPALRDRVSLSAIRCRLWGVLPSASTPAAPLGGVSAQRAESSSAAASLGAPAQCVGSEGVVDGEGGFAEWPSFQALPQAPPPPATESVCRKRVRIHSAGHGAFLIQTEGLALLTDPFFSWRAGPWGRVGPRRLSPPGFDLKSLPRIDAVLLTSSAFDALDSSSLETLHALHAPMIICPTGASRFLPRKLRRLCYAVSPGERLGLLNAEFLFLPRGGPPSLGRWASRVAFGGEQSGAFVVHVGEKRIFVGGAGGFDEVHLRGVRETSEARRLERLAEERRASVFDEIEARWGHIEADEDSPQAHELRAAMEKIKLSPTEIAEALGEGEASRPAFDAALLAMGGFAPSESLGRFHMSPEEAVQAHVLLKSAASVGTRFDVLRLGAETFGQAEVRAQEACDKLGVAFKPEEGFQAALQSKSALSDAEAAVLDTRGFYPLAPGQVIEV